MTDYTSIIKSDRIPPLVILSFGFQAIGILSFWDLVTASNFLLGFLPKDGDNF
jgi:hypothetical protein